MRLRTGRAFVSRAVAAAVLASGLVLPLGIGGVTPAGATFPGSNGRILYFGQVHRLYQVFTVNPDGGGKVQLTHFAKGADVATATADGGTIALASGGNIWVMNADGSGKRRLTSGRSDFEPAISPDGRRIAFSRVDGEVVGLVVMNADGSAQRMIVGSVKFQAFAADWSPDGTKIALTIQRWSDLVGHIYTIKPNGKHLRRVDIAFSPDTIRGALGASWSPDGSEFAFFAQPVKRGKPTCRQQGQFGCQDLYTVGAAGGVPTRLTYDRKNDIFPIWSPDGTQITYSHDSTVGGCRLLLGQCTFDVFVMNADGAGARQLTRTPHLDEEPTWWMASSSGGSLSASRSSV